MSGADLRHQRGPHVFIDDLERPALEEGDRHHLTRSLRLRTGDRLTISDGAGSWRTAVFGDVLDSLGPVHVVKAPSYELSLGIALTKAAKPEFAVQKATEIGIDHVVVFSSHHSVARWDEAKRTRNLQRLQKVAREASMQSRRVRIPTVEVVDRIDSLISREPVRADFAGGPITKAHRFVLIGPEGGWTEEERSQLPESVDLGPTVLRAETAAVVVAAEMCRARISPSG